jgi:hypothetical protein
MGGVNTPTPPRSAGHPQIEPALLGTACCLLSALCYTAANICLRQLAGQQIEPALTICIKEVVSVSIVGPWLLWRWVRGERFRVPWSVLAILVAAGLVVQVAGNLNMQWAFGVVGLAITLPLVFGVNLAASGLIGMGLFGEWLSIRSVVAIVLVIAAITLLSVGLAGGSPARDSLPGASSALVVLLGLVAACVTGAAFATLGAAIRYTSKVPRPRRGDRRHCHRRRRGRVGRYQLVAIGQRGHLGHRTRNTGLDARLGRLQPDRLCADHQRLAADHVGPCQRVECFASCLGRCGRHPVVPGIPQCMAAVGNRLDRHRHRRIRPTGAAHDEMKTGKGSGVVFGQAAFHVTNRRPKTTPDPLGRSGVVFGQAAFHVDESSPENDSRHLVRCAQCHG